MRFDPLRDRRFRGASPQDLAKVYEWLRANVAESFLQELHDSKKDDGRVVESAIGATAAPQNQRDEFPLVQLFTIGIVKHILDVEVVENVSE